MKKMNLVCIALSSILLASCAKDDSKNNAAVQDGKCTEATVNAYNNVIYSVQRLNQFSTRNDFFKVQSSCVSYKNFIGNNSCVLNLVDKTTYQTKESTVNKNSLDSVCNKVDEALSEKNQPTTQTPTSQTPVKPIEPQVPVVAKAIVPGDDIILSKLGTTSIDEVLTAKILNFSKIKSASKNAQFIQNGELFDMSKLAEKEYEPICLVNVINKDFDQSEVHFINFTFDASFNYLGLSTTSLDNLKIEFACFNKIHHKADTLKLKDLRQVFKDLVQFDYLSQF